MATSATSKIENPKVTSHPQWLAARKQLLTKEKEFTRLRDEISRQRRELPWERIEKKYVFGGPGGTETLADLFEGRSQLIVYHFMFGPGWVEGCQSCSLLADHFDGSVPHLNARDVTLVVVSRAPLAQIEAFKKRMGWKFPWVSAYNTDFNFDYEVSVPKEEMEKEHIYNYVRTKFPSEERPGLSVFYKNASGEVFHTYSMYGRGLEDFMGVYAILDRVPKGRDEAGHGMAWVRHHDRYPESNIVEVKAAKT